jgi:uncharacterized repeat protein (TIGR03803 family)
MKRLHFATLALTGGAASLFLAACSASQQPSIPVTNAQAALKVSHGVNGTVSYQVLYSFTRQRNRIPKGAWPHASLTNIKGALYGSTYVGGMSCAKGGCAGCSSKAGCGLIYRMSTSGIEKVIYRFSGGSGDGSGPVGGLLGVNGTLYGVTQHGGGTGCDYGCGTVYSISPAGTETVLHKFTGGAADGAYPDSSLIDVNGTLYGATSAGGNPACKSQVWGGCGTIYSITPSGTERIVYAFAGGRDGGSPNGLLLVDATMYGTTFDGGKGCSGQGCGTLFALTTSGSKKTLHFFSGGAGGRGPTQAIIDVKDTLYGTTAYGGMGFPPFGSGTIFSASLKGATKILYQFAGKGDGQLPGGLTYLNGTFYGTTTYGGGCSDYTCGIVYSFTTGGVETALHDFGGSPDGAVPMPGLAERNGTLFGATQVGGNRECHGGCGTVFTLTP